MVNLATNGLRWMALALAAAVICSPASADVIILNDGRRIETPKALVEGTQVYYYRGKTVHQLPHAQVKEIIKGETDPALEVPEAEMAADAHYRLVFVDGRSVLITDYTDAGDTINYVKYGVRVTLEKGVIRSITRISKDGEQVVFRHGERPQSVPVSRAREGEPALRRMSQESKDRALYNAVVDNEAMDARLSKERKEKQKHCLDGCLQAMLACRSRCNEVLDALKAKRVAEDDPAYVMVRNDVVIPCTRNCIQEESLCRQSCAAGAPLPAAPPDK